MTTRPVVFGVVGAGGIAQSYAQAFDGCVSARAGAVADIRLDAARALGERLACRSYPSYQAVAEEPTIEAVLICTPPVTHAEICLYFAERGIHVLCEKPFAIDVGSARQMLGAGRRAGVRLTMASKFRYIDAVIRAKSIVASGMLGEIILFENAFTSRVDMSSRWNSDPTVSGGGVLLDNGTHSVDLMRYFLGPVAEVQAVEGKRVQGLAVEDTVRVFVRTAGGVMGSIDLSWSINKELDSYINVYGTRGTVAVGWRRSRYRESSGHEWVAFGDGYDKIQGLRRQLENFARAVRGEEALLISEEDALASVEVIEAAYSALHRGEWTPVEGVRV